MKTTVFYHVEGSEDGDAEETVYNEGDFIELLIDLNRDYGYVIDDVVGKAKYIEKYRNKIMDW